MEWAKNVFLFILFGLGIFVCVIGAVLIIHATSTNSQVKNFEEEILIKAPAQDVYSYILDPQKVEEWWGGTQEVVLLTTGLPNRNTKYVLVTQIGDIEVTIKNATKDKTVEISYEFKNTENVGNTTYTLVEQNNNTTVKVKTSVRYLRQTERFWSPITNYRFTQSTKKDLQTLKVLVEK